MIARRMALTAWLAIVMAGCTGASAPTAEPAAPEAALEVVPSEAATVSPTAEATPNRTPKPTPLPVPPKPTGVAFREHIGRETDGGYATISQRVTWKAPRTTGVEIRVYGVTKCFAEPDPAPTGPAGGPCLVKGTRLPASARTLLATAPASDGVARWRWTEQTGCSGYSFEFDNAGPVIYAIVLAAYNDSGNSIFAIAEPGGWYIPAENEVIC
jgi:hypothetical protein